MADVGSDASWIDRNVEVVTNYLRKEFEDARMCWYPPPLVSLTGIRYRHLGLTER